MKAYMFVLLALTSATLVTLTTATWTYEGTKVTLALVNYTYRDPRRDGVLVEVGQVGKYAPGQVASASGRVVVSRTVMAGNSKSDYEDACTFPWSPPSPAPAGPWVALVGRGVCPDKEKVAIAAANNASAIIIYSNDPHAHLRKLAVDKPGVPVVWLGEEEGRGLEGVVGDGAEVVITLAPGHQLRYHVTSVNRTSVLFVSVSFIILMAISLAWLVFYYVQRFRYIHAKDRLARHLCNAAKKALAKIPVKTLKATDKEITLDGECCAVCIELYQVGEAIRTLPCKHQFHRCCVDPWLLEHRTCPMCKMDILKHYGYVLSESEESVMQLDLGDGGEGGRGVIDSPMPLPMDAHSPRTTSRITPVVMVSRSESLRGGRRASINSGVGLGYGSVGGGWQDGVMMGVAVADNPITPIHSITMSPSPPPSLFSLLSPSKSVSPSHSSSSSSSSSAVSTLEKSRHSVSSRSPPPSPPHPSSHLEGDQPHHAATTIPSDTGAVMDLELSSVSSKEALPFATTTPSQSPVVRVPSTSLECVQVAPVPARQTQVHEEEEEEAEDQREEDEEEEEASNPSAHPTPPKRSRLRKKSAPESSRLPAPLPTPASHVVSVSHF